MGKQYQPHTSMPEREGTRWDQQNRRRVGPEEAERIILQTGRMPRPVRLADVGFTAIEKTIVGNEEERRKVASMLAIYSVSKLQAKMVVRREKHPVWQHDRIMCYCKLYSQYLIPDRYSFDPVEIEFRLKFKAAFRENFDPFFKTEETKWEEKMDARGLRPDVIEGGKVEAAVMASYKEKHGVDVQENMFSECILDNVLDVGELVLQHFGNHAEREEYDYSTPKTGKKSKLAKRLSNRIKEFTGSEMDFKDGTMAAEDSLWGTKKGIALAPRPPAQSIHDGVSNGDVEWKKGFFRYTVKME